MWEGERGGREGGREGKCVLAKRKTGTQEEVQEDSFKMEQTGKR